MSNDSNNKEQVPDVIEALGDIPYFSEFDHSNFEAVRVGGLSNYNFVVTGNGINVVVRLAGAGTEEYVDWKAEQRNAEIVHEFGVGAEVLFFDPEKGTMVTRFLEGTQTLNEQLFKDLGVVERASRCLRRLHDIDTPFIGRFDMFKTMDEFLATIAKADGELPPIYHSLKEDAAVVREALETNPVEFRPSHNDPLCENFLDDGQRVFMVDWEYAAMNDPMWDLGDISTEANFDEEQDEVMLQTYFANNVPNAMRSRMIVQKAMVDLAWGLWGVTQLSTGNDALEFASYAEGRFKKCGDILSSDDLGRHLDSIRGRA